MLLAVSCFLSSCSAEFKPGYYPPFIKAAQRGDIEEANRLLLEGEDINQTTVFDHTAMHVAAMEGQDEMVAWLIAHNANFVAQDQMGKYPDQLAKEHGHPSTVKLILDHLHYLTEVYKARDSHNVDELEKLVTSNPWKYTALHNFSEVGDIDAVAELIKRNRDVNAKTVTGKTPLILAVMNGHGFVVSQLLKAGADVNARDIWDGTALYAAAGLGHEHMVLQLLKSGADATIRNKQDKMTLIEAARKNGYTKIVELLQKYETVGSSQQIQP